VGEVKMGSVEALVIARRHRCRVTFGEGETTIEQVKLTPVFQGLPGGIPGGWEVISRAPTFTEAVAQAAESQGWART
jgi:hypothetical protein